jgi:hypothetical protein
MQGMDASERLVDGMLFQDDVGEDFALGGDDRRAGVICRADLSASSPLRLVVTKRSAPAELSKPRTTSGRADEKTRRAAGVT